jgi:hypothetical protein
MLLTEIVTFVPTGMTAILAFSGMACNRASERWERRSARGLKKPSRTADQICGSRLRIVVELEEVLPLPENVEMRSGSVKTSPMRPIPDRTLVRMSRAAVSEPRLKYSCAISGSPSSPRMRMALAGRDCCWISPRESLKITAIALA